MGRNIKTPWQRHCTDTDILVFNCVKIHHIAAYIHITYHLRILTLLSIVFLFKYLNQLLKIGLKFKKHLIISKIKT